MFPMTGKALGPGGKFALDRADARNDSSTTKTNDPIHKVPVGERGGVRDIAEFTGKGQTLEIQPL